MTTVDRPSTALTGRRRELLEAALHVTADEGLRGLTHRAVDRRAGLPEGTTLGVPAHQAGPPDGARRARRRARWPPTSTGWPLELAGCEGDEDRAVAGTLALFERWLEERELVLAKLELSLEAPRDPAVGDAAVQPGGPGWSTWSTAC